MTMHPLETYLRDLHDIRSTGAAVPETSYYGPLANLLNAVGHNLKPKVRCIINLANRGAGIPDGGLFTPDQFQRGADEPLAGAPPSRGAIEVKPTNTDAFVTAAGAQVTRYWKAYGQVLVNNYREQGGDGLVAHDLKQAATTRVFGFEIMPAPFVVAHLQLGLRLQDLGAPLSEANGDRASVYLTNSLTGSANASLAKPIGSPRSSCRTG